MILLWPCPCLSWLKSRMPQTPSCFDCMETSGWRDDSCKRSAAMLIQSCIMRDLNDHEHSCPEGVRDPLRHHKRHDKPMQSLQVLLALSISLSLYLLTGHLVSFLSWVGPPLLRATAIVSVRQGCCIKVITRDFELLSIGFASCQGPFDWNGLECSRFVGKWWSLFRIGFENWGVFFCTLLRLMELFALQGYRQLHYIPSTFLQPSGPGTYEEQMEKARSITAPVP